MNISLRWLSAMVGQTLDADDVAHRLAMLGAPVESITPVHAELKDVLVGLVEHVEPHPNADRLSLCRVNDGTNVWDVVCGAPNVQVGTKYPYAPPGAVLPGGFTLEQRKIRGIVSNGMLCSPRELGLGDDHDGILELTTDAVPGSSFLEAMGLGDIVLDVEVTPNRPDLLCHRGVARDLSAVLGTTVRLEPIPGALPTKAPRRVVHQGDVAGVTVILDDDAGCKRFTAAVITGVTVAPSPDWLARRLQAIGVRPINNVVDVTNYLMYELNQPMHAYDRAKLAGPTLQVRAAASGEALVTLDGQERKLLAGMTLICDAEGPTGVGGVMGGVASEVTNETVDVVLECAYFDPRTIRMTRRALDLSTEASYRFERGIDIVNVPDALRRGVALIRSLAGGEEPDLPIDVYPQPEQPRSVFLRPGRVSKVLGVDVPQADIERILSRLGFTVAPKDDRLAVQAPGWRQDVTREEDLIEEVARVRGYDTFVGTMQPVRPSAVPHDVRELMKTRCRIALTGLGLHEARTASLNRGGAPNAQAVMNPLSSEEAFLRSDLISGLIGSVEHNWAVRETGVRLFEIGSVFSARKTGQLPQEDLHLAAVVTGPRHPTHWTAGGRAVDFDLWDVKSLFEQSCRVVGVEGTLEHEDGKVILRDGKGEQRGWVGELKADRPVWAAPLFGFELRVDAGSQAPPTYQPVPTTPPLERDLALLLPEQVTASQVEAVIRRTASNRLESVTVFDEYRDQELSGRSVAWRLVFRLPDRTLRDKEVDGVLQNVLNTLEGELGVQRREA